MSCGFEHAKSRMKANLMGSLKGVRPGTVWCTSVPVVHSVKAPDFERERLGLEVNLGTIGGRQMRDGGVPDFEAQDDITT